MDQQLIVREAYAYLSKEHQEILLLIDIMGFKYAEAAQILDIAKGTVMSRISRARSEMAKCLQNVVPPSGVKKPGSEE